jgi:RNA ligase
VPIPTWGEITPYIDKGLISEREHPTNPAVRIFNYTAACAFSKAWDDVTRQCRGLVLNVETGEVLANPFPKFFNYQEHIQNEWPIPTEEPTIHEKLDGSLGILVHVDGLPWIATRGSFNSEQAMWATAWWRKHMPPFAYPSNGMTHLFEIVAAWNRIVVKYDYEGMVYLGSRVTATGESMDCWHLFDRTAMRRAKKIPACDLATLAEMDEPNSEGFVCHYPTENVRLKVKFAEYVRLHRLVTGLSEIAIWERMREGKTLDDLIAKVPDEFFQFVTATQTKLQSQYDAIEGEATEQFAEVRCKLAPDSTKKDAAMLIKEKSHRSILFSMLNHHPYADTIWRQIRPVGKSTFTHDIDA